MNIYILPNEESKRINILKYIAIVFVVFIHAYATEIAFADGSGALLLPDWLLLFENLISQTVARCGVPLFFLISSVLLFMTQREYKRTIKGKIRTLLIPYLIWNSFWILVFVLLENLSFTAPYFSGSNTPILQRSISEWLELYGIGWRLPYPKAYPLWFVRDLMVITLFFPLIKKVADKFPRILLTLSAILLLLPVDFPLKQALLWFCIGASIVKLQIHITAADKIPMWILSLAYTLGAFVTLFANNSIVSTLFIFLGIVYWARVTKVIFNTPKLSAILLRFSKYTFIIYVVHELTLTSLKKICLRLLPTEPLWLLMEYILLPVAVIAGCIVFGAVFRKIAPRVYSIATGAR